MRFLLCGIGFVIVAVVLPLCRFTGFGHSHIGFELPTLSQVWNALFLAITKALSSTAG